MEFLAMIAIVIAITTLCAGADTRRGERRIKQERERAQAVERVRLAHKRQRATERAEEKRCREAEDIVKQQHAAEEEVREQCRKKLESYQRQLNQLEATYKERAHLEDDAWIAKYAEGHLDALLKERDRIIGDHQKFHEDSGYIDHLEQHAP